MGRTQKEIVTQLAEEFNLHPHKVEKVLHRYLEVLTEDITAGRAEVPGLGVFALHTRPAHHTTHPKTGQPVEVPKRVVMRYRSAREIRRRLNPQE